MPAPKPAPREARRALLEHMSLRGRSPYERSWAARQLGKLWAEETLDEIAAAIRRLPRLRTRRRADRATSRTSTGSAGTARSS